MGLRTEAGATAGTVRDMATSAREWVASFAEALGTSAPTDAEFDELLGLAGLAAHASERTAAPISCFLVARAGIAPAEALRAAKRLADALAGD